MPETGFRQGTVSQPPDEVVIRVDSPFIGAGFAEAREQIGGLGNRFLSGNCHAQILCLGRADMMTINSPPVSIMVIFSDISQVLARHDRVISPLSSTSLICSFVVDFISCEFRFGIKLI